MDKIIYIRGTYSKEAQRIEMEVRENLNIHDYKTICERLAASLGYSQKSIDEAFGVAKESTLKNNKQILND
tara:strand:+ start:665 stop:877 length:213 start_codon:yes stop_codon:yes gene_type:complete